MREHYAIELHEHAPGKPEDGQKVLLFVHHIYSMRPQKDGTCVLMTAEGLLSVKESKETIVGKGRGYNVIVEVGLV